MKMRMGLILIALLLTACQGKEGPMGPQGVQGLPGIAGLPGPAGPGTRLDLSATVGASGGASVALPAAAGTSINSPPAMTCYLGQSGTTVWLAVAGSASTTVPYCGLVFSNGVFNAVMNGAPVGWIAAFVIVY